MAIKRIKIPPKTVGELLFKSNLQCCVCKAKGDQIHHLNNNRDNDIDNLAYLCFLHHDEASKTGSLSRKLTKEAIINFREQHYAEIVNVRKKDRGELDHPILELTEENLLTASKNALIIIELESIKERFFEAKNWTEKEKVVSSLDKFINHSNNRVAYEIFDFLYLVSDLTSGNMNYSFALKLYELVLGYYPTLFPETESATKIAEKCSHIGFNMIYDAFIHLNNLAVAMCGLSILKLVYRSAENIPDLKNEVVRIYKELELALARQKRRDLDNAIELFKIFKNDVENFGLSYPQLPENLLNIVNEDYKK